MQNSRWHIVQFCGSLSRVRRYVWAMDVSCSSWLVNSSMLRLKVSKPKGYSHELVHCPSSSARWWVLVNHFCRNCANMSSIYLVATNTILMPHPHSSQEQMVHPLKRGQLCVYRSLEWETTWHRYTQLGRWVQAGSVLPETESLSTSFWSDGIVRSGYEPSLFRHQQNGSASTETIYLDILLAYRTRTDPRPMMFERDSSNPASTSLQILTPEPPRVYQDELELEWSVKYEHIMRWSASCVQEFSQNRSGPPSPGRMKAKELMDSRTLSLLWYEERFFFWFCAMHTCSDYIATFIGPNNCLLNRISLSDGFCGCSKLIQIVSTDFLLVILERHPFPATSSPLTRWIRTHECIPSLLRWVCSTLCRWSC